MEEFIERKSVWAKTSPLGFLILLCKLKIGQYPIVLALLFDVSEFAFNKIFIEKRTTEGINSLIFFAVLRSMNRRASFLKLV